MAKIELNEDDRLWRDQFVPNVSDEDLKRMIEVYGGNGKGDGQGYNDEGEGEKEKKATKSELALEAAQDSIKKLFVDEYQTPHAVISVKDHLETLPLRSRRFRNYLSSQTYKQFEIVLDPQTLKAVIDILSARAEFDSGEPIKLNLRVAEVDNGKHGKLSWYYDLTNKDWEFIEITANGWKVVKNQDPNLILFHRYCNQKPQVYPSNNYEPNIFDRFIELVLNDSNVKDKDKLDEYRILLKCYIICALIANIPKAMPMPHGSQGAAKSTLMELCKMLIDPSAVLTLSFPRDINEFIQQLDHNYVAYYDNISTLSDWISDQICRAVSGSGSSKRVLYSDDDDFIRSLMRCIGLNGINLAATKPDILDRSIFLELKRIDDKNRRYVKMVKEQFEEMRPQLLGYIFDILVEVMAWIDKNGMIDLNRLPRMADWAGYCEIIGRCMGLPDDKFIEAYRNNAKIQVEQVMETSEVATCISHLVETDPQFEAKDLEGEPIYGFVGTATALKKKLEDVAPVAGIDIKSKEWPKKANALTRIINIIMHTLKEAGIEVESRHDGKQRIITIRKVSLTSLSSLVGQNQAQNNLENANDNDDLRKVSLVNPEQNHAQKERPNDTNDTNDGLHTNKNPEPPKEQCPVCKEWGHPYWIARHDHEKRNY